jgi:hypothetical protein
MTATEAFAERVAEGALAAPIERVTVLEDRAQITRRGAVSLPAGVARLVLERVAPVVADRTLVARVESGPGKVVDARIERRRLAREEADREATDLARELERAELDEVALDRDCGRAQERLEHFKVLLALRLDEAADDAAWGRAIGEVQAEVATAREEARAALLESLALDRRLEEHRRMLARLRRRLRERTKRPRHAIGASLVIDLKLEAAGEVSLRIDYVVPAAAWRPHHRAIVTTEKVRLETEGCIWQSTGEDWSGVDLVLSTERLSLGVEAPELQSDELRVRRRASVVEVEARDQRIEQAAVEGGLAPDLPGIDDGGEALALCPKGKSHVPSDGRPHRVTLGAIEGPRELALRGHPELDPSVHLVATLVNGARPILAGPVDVVREGGASGRTKLDFVGPNERFELGLGPEPDLRLRRETELKVDEARLLSAWTRTHHRVTVLISNLGRSPRRLHLRERIPVSEIEKVKVTFQDATGRAKPNRDGFVDFERDLGPRATDRIELSYLVDKHDSILGL